MEVLGFIAAILIGISLGLVGSGGSILAFPILVYLFKLDAVQATTYSLFIVGFTALVGTLKYYKLGHLKLNVGLIFAMPSVISLLLVRAFLLPKIPSTLFRIGVNYLFTKQTLIMIVFALLMIVASISMIKKLQIAQPQKKVNHLQLVLMGSVLGALVGFLGAGGGFLIIPVLLFFARLPMKEAVATSLLIIFINSAIGFTGDMLNGVKINVYLLAKLTLIAVAGIFIGTALSKKMDGEKLKPIFGWFILVLGIYMIFHEIFFKHL
jgi:uncharacterized protein